MKQTATTLAVMAVLSGCALSPEPTDDSNVDPALTGGGESSASAATEDDPDTQYTQTLIYTKDDGTTGVIEEAITRRQQIALRDGTVDKSRTIRPNDLTIISNPICYSINNLLRLYDQTNYTGNVLCLAGNNTQLNLTGVFRDAGCGTPATQNDWYGGTYTNFLGSCLRDTASKNRVKSIEAGPYSGFFGYIIYPTVYTTVSWSANQNIPSFTWSGSDQSSSTTVFRN